MPKRYCCDRRCNEFNEWESKYSKYRTELARVIYWVEARKKSVREEMDKHGTLEKNVESRGRYVRSCTMDEPWRKYTIMTKQLLKQWYKGYFERQRGHCAGMVAPTKT